MGDLGKTDDTGFHAADSTPHQRSTGGTAVPAVDHGQDAHATGGTAVPAVDHGQDAHATGSTAVPAVNHGQDAHATGGTAVPAVDHGQDAHATGCTAVPAVDHGQDAHATGGTAVPAVDHGQDAHATGSTAVPAVNHGQDAHATGSTAVSAVDHGQDAHATVMVRHGAYLPHWTAEGATYAVTFRLADSLPQKVLERWLFERENIVKTAQHVGRPLSPHEEKRLHELYSEKVEKYLDAAHGSCWMKDDRVAEIVAKALNHFDGDRYDLLAWCVMPNHVHVVVRPRPGNELPDILHSWKSFTAKQVNNLLGRTGAFWQPEYYDHLIRDGNDFAHCVEYVLRNPEAAGLKGWKWRGGIAVAQPSRP